MEREREKTQVTDKKNGSEMEIVGKEGEERARETDSELRSITRFLEGGPSFLWCGCS